MNLIKKQNAWLPSFADDFFSNDWPSVNTRFSKSVPAVNIKENEKFYALDIAAPGRRKEDFQIELEKDVLSISYEAKNEKSTTEDEFTRREFNYNSFKRSFFVPETVEASKINAVYSEGVLQISLPKRKEAVAAASKKLIAVK